MIASADQDPAAPPRAELRWTMLREEISPRQAGVPEQRPVEKACRWVGVPTSTVPRKLVNPRPPGTNRCCGGAFRVVFQSERAPAGASASSDLREGVSTQRALGSASPSERIHLTSLEIKSWWGLPVLSRKQSNSPHAWHRFFLEHDSIRNSPGW